MEFLLAAISLGFLSSMHCVGMCGPIALALPVHQQPIKKRLASVLLYNSGRIITYGLFGALFGTIGQTFQFFGLQQILSVSIGILVLLGLLAARFTKFSLAGNTINKFLSHLKNRIEILFSQRTLSSFFLIGFLNGFLPCGMVYIAIAGAVSTGSVYKGVLFMMVFGLGTLPFMLTISMYSHLAGIKVRNFFRKAVPLTVGSMAVLLILRGSNLGLGFISPERVEKQSVNKQKETQLKCCHKK